jgi:hypothetical protein
VTRDRGKPSALPEMPKRSNLAALDIGSRLDSVERLVVALDGRNGRTFAGVTDSKKFGVAIVVML